MKTHDVRLIRSPVSVAGMVLTTISAVVFLIVFLADLFGLHTNPYLGHPVLPRAARDFPVRAAADSARRLAGAAAARARTAAVGDPLAAHRPERSRSSGAPPSLIFALTIANIVIVSLAAYRGVEYMDSAQFCGQVCHTVMKPEFIALPGRPALARRLRAVPHRPRRVVVRASRSCRARGRCSRSRFDTYSRPIPSPVQNLRPARDTCEQCHWPEKFHGDKIRRDRRVRRTTRRTPSR